MVRMRLIDTVEMIDFVSKWTVNSDKSFAQRALKSKLLFDLIVQYTY